MKRSCNATLALSILLAAGVAMSDEPTDKEWAQAASTAAVVPDEAKQTKNPFAGDAESLATGKVYFSAQCTMCHGADGRGTGDLVERLKLKMPDFGDPKQQAKRTDGELFYVIQTGHGEMPGQKDRFRDEIKWGMVNYVRSLRTTN